MKAELSVAVVIPTVNRPHLIVRCLGSIFAGELLPDQVIVCDQSHGEETRQAVAKLAYAPVRTDYLRLRRPSASRARNVGLHAARTDLVAFIDDDCVAAPRWLAELVGEYRAASRSERVAAVTGSVRPIFTEKEQRAVSSRLGEERRLFRRSGREGLDAEPWAPWDVGTGANIVAPRAVVLEIGGFDPKLGPGTPARAAEDIDLLYRLSARGALVYQPGAVVYHPAKDAGGRLASRLVYGCGMGSMLGKHMKQGDTTARRLLWLYIRHQGANMFRRGSWGLPESALTLAGLVSALVRIYGRKR